MFDHLKRMVRNHPHLSLAGCGILLILAAPPLFSNLFMLSQFGWINLSLEMQFAGVIVQIALIGIGMFLVSFAILCRLRRRRRSAT